MSAHSVLSTPELVIIITSFVDSHDILCLRLTSSRLKSMIDTYHKTICESIVQSMEPPMVLNGSSITVDRMFPETTRCLLRFRCLSRHHAALYLAATAVKRAFERIESSSPLYKESMRKRRRDPRWKPSSYNDIPRLVNGILLIWNLLDGLKEEVKKFGFFRPSYRASQQLAKTINESNKIHEGDVECSVDPDLHTQDYPDISSPTDQAKRSLSHLNTLHVYYNEKVHPLPEENSNDIFRAESWLINLLPWDTIASACRLQKRSRATQNGRLARVQCS